MMMMMMITMMMGRPTFEPASSPLSARPVRVIVESVSDGYN
jgi:hypothetical protein